MPELRSRHGVDTIFAATLALKRHCTGVRLVPHAVEHQMPACLESEYTRFFGVTPTWSRPASRMLFSRADLALPFHGAAPELAELLSEHVPRLMRGEHGLSFEQAFERAFWAAHEAGRASLESTAVALEISPRTLQRRLTSMGTTFAVQRGEILHRRALSLLRDDRLSIEAIAERLGYASRAAFERAFARWSGKTPRSVRNALD